MKHINISFKNEEDKISFVQECEKNFHNYLKEISKTVVEKKTDIVLLSGPTCSGKTTLANKIIHDFTKKGKDVKVISIDDFFMERNDSRTVEEGKKIDYDSIEALDFQLLKRCVSDLYKNGEIDVPIYDFVSQKRVGFNHYKIEKDTVVIFEGIQAVYPEITALFEGYDYIGIFTNVEEDVCVNGVYFSRDDIRLSRRIVRDRKFRGASADFSLYLWETVRENEDKNIYPNKNICKIQMNSFLDYELFVIKKYIIEVLSDVEPSSRFYSKAFEMREKYKLLDEISFDYVPGNSLYTEFLGKK
ncbi:MAG: Flp pilus assembly complex ATPase component TadA [Clostridia bacterium]|nr:Flp pilus assembly complex ATPase component TadA [Clostridia bacterium]